MSKFIAYVKQAGEGCDYTIGCARTLWELEAQTYEDALLELEEVVAGEEGYFGESRLESIVLYEVVREETMPLANWYTKAKTEAEILKAEKEIEQAFALYSRLKERFENK